MVKCSKCGCINYVGSKKNEFTCAGCYRRMVIKKDKNGKIKVKQKINWWDLIDFRGFMWKYFR